METAWFETRRANWTDAEHLAAAHVDSIRSIGARFYTAEIVDDWCDTLTDDVYVRAMQRGEVFHIAVGTGADMPGVLGFASHRVDGTQHRTAVYVRGAAARRGVGSAVFRSAEAEAIAAGARTIHVAASLAAVEFYRSNGFSEVRRGEHRLRSGRELACVFMRKRLER